MVAQLRDLPARAAAEQIDGLLQLLSLHGDRRATSDAIEYGWIVLALLAIFASLLSFNRYRANTAVLAFEELQPEEITTLGLTRDGVSITELSMEFPVAPPKSRADTA